VESSPIGGYLKFLRDRFLVEFGSYEELHAWSTRDLSTFWSSVWEY
jgi:acetoacetyl-CoA synthetase